MYVKIIERKIHCKTIFQHINKHSLDPLEGLNTDKIVNTVDGHGVDQLVSVELPHALNWKINMISGIQKMAEQSSNSKIFFLLYF